MSKKLTVTISVTYNFRGSLLKEYLEWLDDYKDTKRMRKAFAIDRLVPLNLIDPASKVSVKEID